jgi:uncharacterized membrane protein
LRLRRDLCYFCALIVRQNYSRNCSISPAAFAGVLALLAVVTLSIGIGFALMGAWLILPFAGLEVLALGAAFLVHAKRFTR